MARPTAETVQRLMASFQSAEDVDYFFDQLNSPVWLEPLSDAGLFDDPPAPIVDEVGTRFPGWAASRYLVRVADSDPATVAEILAGLPDTDNVRVLHDVVDGINRLPVDRAVGFVPAMIGYLEKPFKLLLPEKLANVIRRFVLSGQEEAGLRLTSALFALREPEAQLNLDRDSFAFPQEALPVIDRYDYERLIHEVRQDLIAGSKFAGFEVLIRILSDALLMEFGAAGPQADDISWMWRPAIETHPQNSVPYIKAELASAVRDAALQLAGEGRPSLEQVVTMLEKGKWSILRRIALHTVRLVAQRRSALVSKRLLDRGLMFDAAAHHEYWLLLHDRFATLTKTQQSRLLQSIEVAPPIFSEPDGPFGDEGDAAREAWQVRMLAAIHSELEDGQRAWYQHLVDSGRLGTMPPDFQSYHEGGWVGPTSPLTDTELAQLSDEQLIDYAKTWVPSPQSFMAPSQEGLARAIQGAISQRPNEWATRSAEFQGLAQPYVNGYLAAFRELANAGRTFPWEPILRLAVWVVSQPEVVESDDGITDWTWTRSTVAHLLASGFNSGAAEIPITLRRLAWQALEPLTTDRNPTPEHEDRYGGSNMDPTTLAINTVRGQAIEATIKYVVWIHRSLEGTKAEFGLEQSPEAMGVLEHHLDLDADASIAVHSVYGYWFPFLALVDETWARLHVNAIFPTESDKEKYWAAAWDAYVGYSRPYDSVFPLLKEQYVRAVGYRPTPDSGPRRPMMVLQHYAEHVMVFLLRGVISMDDRLVEQFYAEATPELRATAMRFVGRSTYRISDHRPQKFQEGLGAEVLHRAQLLWEKRLTAARLAEDRASFRKEVAQFGWWFASPEFDVSWLLPQLVEALRIAGYIEPHHQVLPRLADIAGDHPEEALEALALMLEGEKGDLALLGSKDSVSAILQIALGEPESHGRAEELTHELGARGYREFRGLLSAPD